MAWEIGANVITIWESGYRYRKLNSTIDYITVDTPRPFVSCPQDMDVELPARQNTIRVTFPQPKSNMNWWRYVHASPPWAKQLQADLPAGTTVVTFTAWSPVSNYTSTCRIVIRVRDADNPKVTMCPTSFEVRLSPGERNRLIFWQEPTFTDNVGVEHVYKTRGPGHVMYPGVHSVRYVASDAAGNRAECHFSIHVRESEENHNSEPRFYRRKMLMCPGRPPQPVPSSSYGWQIPSGCYLRYTRIFSGAYQRHPERWRNSYQDAGASYRRLPPIQIQSRRDVALPYNNNFTREENRKKKRRGVIESDRISDRSIIKDTAVDSSPWLRWPEFTARDLKAI
ncbi:Sushi, von Willebrand factor type A, EGF and pentraxin domain-containing protein 1 [Camponotus floridanus]|uniref:Sushi, von Willebrand factor type A, EGF and pentraxin domain-containing protein 1 n=1 Tax=Camponotus floridanus TaxID=104421 RepID=E2ANB7_CAMFO|nr:Sushi, von Willebrand factor type A, EGF and pentraxin domain-containing protein 1 [Camponotus floridanus]